MQALQLFGLVAFAAMFAAMLTIEVKHSFDARAGRRFHCSAGLVDLQPRALNRFRRLMFVRCDVTDARLAVTFMPIVIGHDERSSLVVERDAARLIRLDPIDAAALRNDIMAPGVHLEVLGRVMLRDGNAKTMAFMLSEADAERLRVVGPDLGWDVVVGRERLPSPLSAPLDAFAEIHD